MSNTVSDVYTQGSRLETALTELSSRETAFGEALDLDAVAEHAYKLAKASAFLASEGTEKAREAQSVVSSEKLFLDHLKKKAVKEFTREKLRDCQDALSARQSLLSSSVKSDLGYANNRQVT
jgi:hypothetical protein